MQSSPESRDRFEIFLDTLSRYEESKLLLADEILLAEIHEELSIEAVSFLHDTNVGYLIAEKMIPAELASEIESLRELTLKLIESKAGIAEIRNAPEWKQARSLATHIKTALLKTNPLN